MAGQLALDFNRHRLRALQFEGSARNPKIRGFAVADLPDAEGASTAEVGDVLASTLRAEKMPRDPAACALDSYFCTFREMDLPFTEDDQIRKVLKFEAETHLHLVDIEEVVVDYRKLADSRDGSHLLVMAYEKEAINRRLAAMSKGGVDPHFADLHLTALFSALEHFGYFQPPEAEDASADDDAADEGIEPPAVVDTGLCLVLECDHDATHLLVVQDGVLRAARAMRLGILAPERGEDAEGHGPDDESFVLEIDHEGGERVGGLPAEQFFRRLQREVQRTLFPLGLAETPARLMVLGPAVRDARFLDRLQQEMEHPVEVPRVFDSLDHRLDGDALELANAEGVAALGVAMRLLGAIPSAVDFRQEEVRYARRFDQIKVALACAALVAAIAAFLYGLQDLQHFFNRRFELSVAANEAIYRHREFVTDTQLEERYRNKEIDALQATNQASRGLSKKRTELANLVGGDGSIPRVPSGLTVLNEVLSTVGDQIPEVGRLELNKIQLNLIKENPSVVLQGIVLDFSRIDTLKTALEKVDCVQEVVKGKDASFTKDQRVLFDLQVKLKPEWSVNPRVRR